MGVAHVAATEEYQKANVTESPIESRGLSFTRFPVQAPGQHRFCRLLYYGFRCSRYRHSYGEKNQLRPD